METKKRLIDANKLIEALPIVTEDKKISLYGAVADVTVMISAMPTVDAVEVVHGRWLKAQVEAGDPFDGNSCYLFDVFQCSECDAHFDVSEAMNYCPNCGADMRGTEHE